MTYTTREHWICKSDSERIDHTNLNKDQFGSLKKLMLKGDLHERLLVVKLVESYLLPNF